MSQPRIVLLAGDGDSTRILYHELVKEFTIDRVILEAPVPKKQFLKRRIKKLGWAKVSAQVLFQAMIVPLLSRFSASRRKEILEQHHLNDSPIPGDIITHVTSVNDDDCQVLLQQLQPGIVVVNGTRIIASRILKSVDGRFVNTHAGITPKYRGVHGAYWALVNNDPEHCGVTVHLVDPGIDTGAVIYQQLVQPSSADNFTTYPLLQLAAGVPLMKKAIADIASGHLQLVAGTSESHLWSHPGIFQYLFNRWFRGKK